MECYLCKVEKLPNEFPPETVTDECKHPILYCLRCTIKKVSETQQCPHPGCGKRAEMNDQKLLWFQAILREMFKEYTTEIEDDSATTIFNPLITHGTLTVSLLTGESITVPFSPYMKIIELKKRIFQELGHEVDKQKLLYNEKELTAYVGNKPAMLMDFGVKPNSTLCLVILLFTIPDEFDHVVFDLYWGYPITGCDYLDASCLLYSGSTYFSLCDYKFTQPHNAIEHSGDVMDDQKRTGHHTIHVRLKSLPATVTHLFFTLSAWSSPNISRYPSPSLKFYEAATPGKDLCKTTFNHARHSQAVVMCSMSRSMDGGWKIFESGKLSAGNAKNYGPLQDTVRALIIQGF